MKPATVPASLVGLYIDAHVTSSAYGKRVTGHVTRSTNEGFVLVDYEQSGFGTLPVAETDLLLDSPLAMCHVARWLATRLGWNLNMLSAVQWVPESKAFHRNVKRTFVLRYSCYQHWFHDDPLLLRAIERGALPAYSLSSLTHVPGIASTDTFTMSITERVEALAAACVAVGGAS